MNDGSIVRGRSTSGASESSQERGLLKRGRSKSEIGSNNNIITQVDTTSTVGGSVPKLDLRSARLRLQRTTTSVRFEDESLDRNPFHKAVEDSELIKNAISFNVRFSETEQNIISSPRTRGFSSAISSNYFEDWAKIRIILEQILKEEIVYICDSLYRISKSEKVLKLKDGKKAEFVFEKENIQNMLDKFSRRISRERLDDQIRKLCEEEIIKSFELNVQKLFQSSIEKIIQDLMGKNIKCDLEKVKSVSQWVFKYVTSKDNKDYSGFFNHFMTVVMGLNTMVLQTSIILGNKNEQITFEEGVNNSGFERVVINQPTGALEGVIDDEDKLNPLLKFLFERHKYFFLVDTFDKITGNCASSRFAQILKKSYSNLTTQMRDGGNCNILDIIKCEVEVLEYLAKRLSFKGFVIWPNEKQDTSIIKSPRAEAPLSPREEGVKIDESYTAKLRRWVEEALFEKSEIIRKSQPSL